VEPACQLGRAGASVGRTVNGLAHSGVGFIFVFVFVFSISFYYFHSFECQFVKSISQEI
jgi:hypothetical protein